MSLAGAGEGSTICKIDDESGRAAGAHAGCIGGGHKVRDPAGSGFGVAFLFRDWGADFRNAMAALERSCFWQLGLGRRVDSLQFYGRFGAGQRDCGIVEDSAVAAVAFLRGAGNSGSVVGLHNRVWSAVAWGVAAAGLANALELSTDAAGIALCSVFSNSPDPDNGDGSDVAGIN